MTMRTDLAIAAPVPVATPLADARSRPRGEAASAAEPVAAAAPADHSGAEAHRGRWLYGPAVDFLLLGGGSFIVLAAMAAFFPRDEASRVALAGAMLRSAPTGLARFLFLGDGWDSRRRRLLVGAHHRRCPDGYDQADQAVFGATLFLFIGWTFINIHHYFIDNVIWRCDTPEARRYPFTASGRPTPIGGRDGQTQTGGWHRWLTPRSTHFHTRSSAFMKKHLSKHKSRRFRRFLRANKAVSALEYAILVGVIAVAVAAALVTFGTKIDAAITAIGNDVAGTGTAGAPSMTSP